MGAVFGDADRSAEAGRRLSGRGRSGRNFCLLTHHSLDLLPFCFHERRNHMGMLFPLCSRTSTSSSWLMLFLLSAHGKCRCCWLLGLFRMVLVFLDQVRSADMVVLRKVKLLTLSTHTPLIWRCCCCVSLSRRSFLWFWWGLG